MWRLRYMRNTCLRVRVTKGKLKKTLLSSTAKNDYQLIVELIYAVVGMGNDIIQSIQINIP